MSRGPRRAYRIESPIGGTILGTYLAWDARDAIRLMCEDANHDGPPDADLRAVELPRVELRESNAGHLALVCSDGSAFLGIEWTTSCDFESDAAALLAGDVDEWTVESASHIGEGFATVATWSPEVGRDVDEDRCGAAATEYLRRAVDRGAP